MTIVSDADRELLKQAGQLPEADYGTRIYSMHALLALAIQREVYELEIAQLKRQHRDAGALIKRRRNKVAVTTVAAAGIGIVSVVVSRPASHESAVAHISRPEFATNHTMSKTIVLRKRNVDVTNSHPVLEATSSKRLSSAKLNHQAATGSIDRRWPRDDVKRPIVKFAATIDPITSVAQIETMSSTSRETEVLFKTFIPEGSVYSASEETRTGEAGTSKKSLRTASIDAIKALRMR